jgi:electron transport complex protein RnfE
MRNGEALAVGIARENPVAILLLGLCPAAAVTARVVDALWMSAGVAAVVVLASLCAAIIARPLRLFASLMLASLLTASFELCLAAIAPVRAASLGIYAPLIAVNCLVLAGMDLGGATKPSKGKVVLDAAGKGIGFAAALLLIALFREVLGAGTITLERTTIVLPGLAEHPVRALGLAGGGLLCLGYLAGLARVIFRPAPGQGKEGPK